MSVDPAFKVVQKGKAGFYCWRIEKLQVVPVPKDDHGSFFEGDSYIILSMKETKAKLDSHIHFWLGKDTSQDEAGVAAYKSVELDDYLGGDPVQHREVQGEESKTFMTYFKSKGGVKYSKGGVASGFNHVEHVFKKRLLWVKGKQYVRISEVDISWDSMNSGDSFILDLGQILYIWVGKDSSRTERLKAMEHARQLRDDRGAKPILVPVDDGNEKQLQGDQLKLFDAELPINSKKVKSKEAAGDDTKASRQAVGSIRLYLCSDESGTLKITEQKCGPIEKKDLVTSESFIIDNGALGIWAWIGKGASKSERKEAMRNALGYIGKKNLPSTTPVTRVIEGGEPTEFKALFKSWPLPPTTGKVYSRSRIAKTVQTKFDASTLHENQQLAAETQMVDDGSGKYEVWRIQDFELVPVDKKFFGQFFGGDCYVIKYTYLVSGKENYLIYFWLGNKSTADEQGAAALKTVELDDAVGGSAVQIRVVQGKEPPHLLTMFEGKMIVFSGGKAGWSSGPDNDGPGDKYMLQVFGTSTLNTKAVQVELRAASLNSNDVFVIFDKKAVYIWAGKGCTGDEREMAKRIASISPREATMVFEGKESKEFWAMMGGKEEYATSKRLQEADTPHEARLFQVSNASGNVTAEEIEDFTQHDLVTDDVMILDCYDEVFVWVGEGANKAEKDGSSAIAAEYIKTDPSGRDEGTPILKLKQGCEPPNFTGFFPGWDRGMWSQGKTYEEMKKEFGEANVGLELVKEKVQANGGMDFQSVAKYTYEDLRVPADKLPNDVDAGCRELHLNSDEFESLFKMKYAEFVRMPPWKQTQLKKNLTLF